MLRGELTFGAGAAESTVGPGTFVHIPGGTTHWFRFGDGGGEMLSLTSPAGAADFFRAISRPASGDAPAFADLVRIAADHGGTVLPLPGDAPDTT